MTVAADLYLTIEHQYPVVNGTSRDGFDWRFELRIPAANTAAD
jgi:hypothetical protein